jgi:hypothetical protein
MIGPRYADRELMWWAALVCAAAALAMIALSTPLMG